MTDVGNLTGGAWWAATEGDDFYRYGPEKNMGDALAEWFADSDEDANRPEDEDSGFSAIATVVYATNPPIRLADWLEAGAIIEAAEDDLYSNDRVSSEYDDGAVFDATPEQIADLDRRLKAAADEWQAAHGLKFTVSTFEAIPYRRDIHVNRAPGESQDAALQRALDKLEAPNG